MKRISLILLLLSIPVLMRAQHPSDYNAGGKFPQINADNSVTFQVRAPQAKAIGGPRKEVPYEKRRKRRLDCHN